MWVLLQKRTVWYTTMAESKRDARSGFSDNWQAGKNFPESNLYMLDNRICCDVSFRVGQKGELVEAHRFILVSRSCVFEAMLNGPMAETGEIEIPDTEPGIFRHFLQFLYTNNVTLDLENVAALLYLSKKYDVSGLEKLCVEYLEFSLVPSNACVILEQAHKYDEKDLYKTALDIIKRNGKDAVQSEEFTEVCDECLEQITMADDLVIEEENLFTAALWWAEAQCKRQAREVTAEAKRGVLGKSLFYIRFPVMDANFFVDTVCRTGVLTDSEKMRISEYFAHPENKPTPFNFQRRYFKMRKCERFPNIAITDEWFYNVGSAEDAVTFSCNSNINLHGFQLYRQMDEPYSKYTASASVREDNAIVLSSSLLSLRPGDDSDDIIFEAVFDKPLPIDKDKNYTLVVLIKGPSSFYGDGDSDIVTDEDVTFHFSKSRLSKYCTKVGGGKIPGLLYTLRD